MTNKYQIKLADKLGFDIDNPIEFSPQKLYLENNEYLVGGALYTRVFNRADGKKLRMFALSWDEVTVEIQKAILEVDKDFLETNGSKNREEERVWLNRQLKKFVNKSFSDPVLYIGEFGHQIRHIVATGIEKIQLEIDKSNDIDSNKIVLIADSLGSSVTFDTVNMLNQLNKESIEVRKGQELVNTITQLQASARAEAQAAAALQFADNTQIIHMNANQLPLIELGKIKGPSGNDKSFKSWLDNYPCPQKTGVLGFENTKTHIVAYTDPNDALSYYLTERIYQNCGAENNTNITNVYLTNAWYNVLHLYAPAGKAHAMGFKTNDKALDIIVNGVQ